MDVKAFIFRFSFFYNSKENFQINKNSDHNDRWHEDRLRRIIVLININLDVLLAKFYIYKTLTNNEFINRNNNDVR